MPKIGILIGAIGLCTQQVLQKIGNKGEFAYLKKNIKWPMFLLASSAGMIGGLQASVMRGMTISKFQVGFGSPVTLAYLATAGGMAGFQLYTLN